MDNRTEMGRDSGDLGLSYGRAFLQDFVLFFQGNRHHRSCYRRVFYGGCDDQTSCVSGGEDTGWWFNGGSIEQLTPTFFRNRLTDVKKSYKKFKNFDSVVDHPDHFFSAQNSAMNQLPVKTICKEWKILKKHLPETIYVRVYESRIDLLRAVIVGPEGTPYHNGLFFFDVCFPVNYPNSPPLVYYHYGGLGINPNLDKCGKVRLSLPRTSGGQETMWVAGTSTILQLLVSIQNQILNVNPLFNEPTYALMKGSFYGDQSSALYNENILIKSLKTMMYIIEKPPKNFEGVVCEHFGSRARDILMSCKKSSCSITFKNDMDSCIKPLVGAFRKFKAKKWVVRYSTKNNQVIIL